MYTLQYTWFIGICCVNIYYVLTPHSHKSIEVELYIFLKLRALRDIRKLFIFNDVILQHILY